MDLSDTICGMEEGMVVIFEGIMPERLQKDKKASEAHLLVILLSHCKSDEANQN